jgi:hypothetical protein
MNSALFNSMVTIAEPFGIDPYFTYAVGTVESNNTPFLPNGSPIVRFEKHVFLRQLKKHKASASMIDRANRLKGSNFNTLVSAMSIEDKVAAMSTVESALELDDYCAMMATSYGIFQIMGFNHQSAGYNTVASFVEAMGKSEENQIKAFCNFIKDNNLVSVMKKLDFATFARRYNGPNYAENSYDVKLRKAYNAVKK